MQLPRAFRIGKWWNIKLQEVCVPTIALYTAATPSGELKAQSGVRTATTNSAFDKTNRCHPQRSTIKWRFNVEFILEIADSRQPPEKRLLRLQDGGAPGILGTFMGTWGAYGAKAAGAFTLTGGDNPQNKGDQTAKWFLNPNEKKVYVKEYGKVILDLELENLSLPLFVNYRKSSKYNGIGVMYHMGMGIKDGDIKWRCVNVWA
ncbi:MAG: hypothetical protein WD894_09805 [Pirellulales bacterium]